MAPGRPLTQRGCLKRQLEIPTQLFLENEVLYGQSFEVPGDPEIIVPIGKANIVSSGTDVTIVTFSIMVGKALEAASN